jgi:transcriptional regulator with XRE-family HTH domain
MLIGKRVKQIRAAKGLSQGDIERKCGLLREYVSRVENGYMVPAIETLEKIAHALSVPVCVLVYDGEKPPAPRVFLENEDGWGASGKDARSLDRFRRYLGESSPRDRKLLMQVASKMAARGRRGS